MHYQSRTNDKDIPWTFEFWENSAGVCVVERDFLSDLMKKDPLIYETLAERMDRVTQYPLSNQSKAGNLESIGNGLYEFKFHLQDEVRFLGHISYEGSITVFYVFCAFKKKDNKLPKKQIRLALERYEEFKLMKFKLH